MQHHFGDLLDRDYDYWQIIPNKERYAYLLPEQIENKNEIKITTITGEMPHWEAIFSLENLEEITLHNPNAEQVVALSKLKNIKRLRITGVRLKDIDFIANLTQLEELVFEFVSVFSDLSPLKYCQKLKSIHLECLRSVKDFNPLSELKNLRYLAIVGSLDWKQTIENFAFLGELSNLEFLKIFWFQTKTPAPALLSIRNLKKLKFIHLDRSDFYLEDLVFCQIFAQNAEIIDKNLTKKLDSSDTLYFWGKGSGRVKESAKNSEQKIAEFMQKYEDVKQKIKNEFS